ncbi:hypothetical protein OESDEN_23193 [Oesophagostomum dentatum]|uniref:Uncharacterized protein n=1 Tax=Oesophagostomum dentatum TaxID=61180 RepID=A0A0B1S138_OESDE|nr:hypothetical protein OESDEN_23193 [Oesophagostomum dentatum]
MERRSAQRKDLRRSGKNRELEQRRSRDHPQIVCAQRFSPVAGNLLEAFQRRREVPSDLEPPPLRDCYSGTDPLLQSSLVEAFTFADASPDRAPPVPMHRRNGTIGRQNPSSRIYDNVDCIDYGEDGWNNKPQVGSNFWNTYIHSLLGYHI